MADQEQNSYSPPSDRAWRESPLADTQPDERACEAERAHLDALAERLCANSGILVDTVLLEEAITDTVADLIAVQVRE